jgi:hypothetical protein
MNDGKGVFRVIGYSTDFDTPDPQTCCRCGYPADGDDTWNGSHYCEECIDEEDQVFRCVHCKGLFEADAEDPYQDSDGARFCFHCYQKVLHIHATYALEARFEEVE